MQLRKCRPKLECGLVDRLVDISSRESFPQTRRWNGNQLANVALFFASTEFDQHCNRDHRHASHSKQSSKRKFHSFHDAQDRTSKRYQLRHKTLFGVNRLQNTNEWVSIIAMFRCKCLIHTLCSKWFSPVWPISELFPSEITAQFTYATRDAAFIWRIAQNKRSRTAIPDRWRDPLSQLPVVLCQRIFYSRLVV